MNILYIIGNGFDLRLGLKTRYSDFFRWYTKKPTSNPSINNFKRTIDEDLDTWSNLELKLGEYTSNFDSCEDFHILYHDLKNELGEYLKFEQSKYRLDDQDKALRIKQDLCYPEKYLAEQNRNILMKYKNQIKAKDSHIRIITLNYTKVIDSLIKSIPTDDQLNGEHKNHIYDEIIHAHGLCDKAMIFGVNDISQIHRIEFRKDITLTDYLVKPKSNDATKNLTKERCKDEINKSDLICLYGLSLGETDKYWWNLIKETMRQNKNLKTIIFYKDRTFINERNLCEIEAQRRKIVDHFVSVTKLDPKNQDAYRIRNNIFAEYDSDIFNVTLDQISPTCGIS